MKTEVLVYYLEQNKIGAMQQFKGQKFGLRNNNSKFLSIGVFPPISKLAFGAPFGNCHLIFVQQNDQYVVRYQCPDNASIYVWVTYQHMLLALTIVCHSFYSQHTVCVLRFMLLISALLYSALNSIGNLDRLFEAKSALS